MVAPSSLLRSPLPVALVFLAALITTGEAIQCYMCNSVTDAYCADPFSTQDARQVTCSPTAVEKSVSDASRTLSDVLNKFGVDVPAGTKELSFVCQKVKQTDKNGNDVILRSCAFNPETVDACPPRDTGVQCLQCNSDLCNGAPAGFPATGVRLLALVALPAAALRLLRP